MAFVETLTKTKPLVFYKISEEGVIDLDSVMVVGLANGNQGTRARIYVQPGLEYQLVRAELLTADKFSKGKTPITIPEANRLRAHLRTKYHLQGLEGDLE